MSVSCLRRASLMVFALVLSACDKTPEVPKAPASSAPAVKAMALYQPVDWSALPQTSEQELLEGFSAWRSACQRLAKDPIWGEPCAQAAEVSLSLEAVNGFLQSHLTPYLLQSPSKGSEGLITGYFEPVYPGSLTRTAKAQVPVYGVPDDMIVVKLESLYPELAGKRLRGRLEGNTLVPYADAAHIRDKGVEAKVLVWLEDAMDLQFLQIQGSGRVALADGRELRLGYAEQNGHPYRPIGRWLLERGELSAEALSMQSIRAWAKQHPEQLHELLNSNPSYVFFAQNPDSQEGPRGSLNVPLTAGYSVAIDRKIIPLGSLLWLSTSAPDGTPIKRPVAAQDTGGAIVGEVRADFFFGTGELAGELAGAMKQPGQLWLLWPKAQALPAL